ncbi:MAG: cupin domain-containing protein [Cyanophyceae cyanobacterium]
MSAALISPGSPFLQLTDHLIYPESGILSRVLWKSDRCQYTLFCLAAGTEISEHTAVRDGTVQVLAGSGVFTLNGEAIALAPGVFIAMAAHAPHAIAATSNLAFLLTLSDAN